VVQSRSKRKVTADEKAADDLEESALALELVCEEARAAAVALDNAKAEHGQLAAARKISGLSLAIYGDVLVAENI
jgi:hypothetical protein